MELREYVEAHEPPDGFPKTGYPQVQSDVTFGTLCRARNALNPIFSVRSCVARELSALYKLSWRWGSFRVVSRTCAATLLSSGTLFLCLT